MKDYLNRDIKIGDRVVYSRCDTAGLTAGVVERFTKLYVVVKSEDRWNTINRKTSTDLIVIHR